MRRRTFDALKAGGVSQRRVGFGVAGELVNLAPSLVSFLVVPRVLGPGRYGVLAALLALVALVASCATLGAHIVLVRDIARGASSSDAAGKALTTTLLGGVAGALVAIPLATLVLRKIDVLTIVLVFVAELVVGNLRHVFAGLAIAHEDQATLATFRSVNAGLRIAATIAYVVGPGRGSLRGFAWWYSSAVVAGCAGCYVIARTRSLWEKPRRQIAGPRDISDGLAISSTAAVFYAQDGLDTPIIVHAGYDVDAGAYASAYRVASLAFAPVNALVQIGLPRLVSRIEGDDHDARVMTAHLTVLGVAYGVLVAAVMIVAAPVIPWIVGSRYHNVSDMLRWLSLLPLLRAAQYFVANMLMLNHRQRARLIVQLVSAAAGLVAYIVLIPAYSWRGAVAGTYVSECLLAGGLWWVFLRSASARCSTREELDGVAAG